VIAGLSLVYLFSSLPLTAKVLYSEDERIALRPLPIPEKNLLKAKLGALYLHTLADYGLMEYGFFLSYGIVTGQKLSFYAVAFVSVLLSALAVLFFALLFSRPYERLRFLINGDIRILIPLGIFFAAVIGTLYFLLLLVILKVIASDNVANLFSVQKLSVLGWVAKCSFPFSGLVGLSLFSGDIALLITCPVITLSYLFFGPLITRAYFRSSFKDASSTSFLVPEKNEEGKPFRFFAHPLFLKELFRSLRGTQKTFSSLFLLILVPLFSFYFGYLISQVYTLFGLTAQRSLDSLLSSGVPYVGALFVSDIPLYQPVLIFFLLSFFSALVYSPGNDLFSEEENSLPLLLSIPVDFRKQLSAKFLFTLSLSALTSLLSSLILLASSVLSPSASLFFFLFCFCFTVASYLFSEGTSLRHLFSEEESGGGLLFLLLSALVLFFLAIVEVSAFSMSLSSELSLVLTGILSVLSALLLSGLSYLWLRKAMKQALSRLEKNGGRIRA
jgi:hypothetical protein